MKFNKILLISALLLLGWQAQAQEETKRTLVASAKSNPEPSDIYKGEESMLFNEEDEDDDVPSSDIYESWTNEKVNPYQVAVKDLPDLQLDSLLSKYVHPLDTGSRVTSNFGPRHRRFHYGIDLKLYVGQDVYAAFDGKIRVTGFDRRGYGNYVVIRHPNGLETLYGHLSEIKVEANKDVKAGDLIGLGGSTGRSTGPHLHFEFRYLGHAINPTYIIDYQTNKPISDRYLINKTTSFHEVKAYQSAKYHVVKRGETLSGIAHRYGTTVTKICQLNGLKRNATLRPKQRLRYS